MKAKRVFLFLCTILGVLALVLGVWTWQAEAQAHFTPDYPKEDLSNVIEQDTLGARDYSLLFRQTGVSEAGIRKMWEQGRQQELQVLQERLFAPVEIICENNTIISREERLAPGAEQLSVHQAFPLLEEGDILISFNCHVFGWRSGHAALVVDAEQGRTLEARVLGMDSAILSMQHWVNYPSVAVLRVKGLTQEQRKAVADYAVENLKGIPYRLLTRKQFVRRDELGKVIETEEKMVFAGGAPELSDKAADLLPAGTHCAHLVWSAFAAFGYDMDGDGGFIVTPRDLFESELVEVVQLYGMKGDFSNS